MTVENVVIPLAKPEKARLEEGRDYFYAGDYLKASKIFTKLIDDGVDEAYYFMGCIYEVGNEDIKKDLMKSIFYYNESAEFGFVEGLYGLGRLVYYGMDGIGINYTEAFRIYTALNVTKGHVAPVAKLMLGQLYETGRGTDKNLALAKKYYAESWKLGNVFALLRLGQFERKYGNYLKGTWLGLRFFVLFTWMHTFDIDNPRLREG